MVKENAGKARLVARDFPLSQHAEAFKAAEPAEADKGERQQRGQKLLMSAGRPLTKVRFLVRLKLGD